jgi:hypothetical protein
MATAHEVYDGAVRALPPPERLRLAALILQELTRPVAHAPDVGEAWSAEDLRDLTESTLGHAVASYPENEDGLSESWAELGMDRLEAEWDNPRDAIYDDWRRLYGVERG